MSNTWSIENLDNGEITLIDHIEIKTRVSTLEKTMEGKGFGMIAHNAKIELREHPSVGHFIILQQEES